MDLHSIRWKVDRLPRLPILKPENLNQLWDWIQNTELSFQIGATWVFPLLESIHVLSVVFLFSSILIVDLRIMRVSALNYPIQLVYKELVPWSWAAFAISCISGLGLFISRPGAYAENPAFQIKMCLLLLAGVNLALFKLKSSNDKAHAEDVNQYAFSREEYQACLSVLIWASVIFAGRWIGHIN
jgi:hypothetical protein